METSDALKILRNSCEKGLDIVHVYETPDMVLVVLSYCSELGETHYYCNRYFTIGDSWVLSRDRQKVDDKTVFAWLVGYIDTTHKTVSKKTPVALDSLDSLEYLEDFLKDNGNSVSISIANLDAGGNYVIKVRDGSGKVLATGPESGEEAHETLAKAIRGSCGH